MVFHLFFHGFLMVFLGLLPYSEARSTTESAALKARLQALELRLAAAALERVSAQASSAHKASREAKIGGYRPF